MGHTVCANSAQERSRDAGSRVLRCKIGAEDAFNRHGEPPSVAGMLARVTTFTIDGLEPRRVTVEIDVRAGLPNFTIVGLADRAVREARERVRAAILNSGFEFPLKRVTVNLAPASLRKATLDPASRCSHCAELAQTVCPM